MMIILSCNIRCFGADDGPNDWVHRKDFCIELIASKSPDIICCQEVWAEQYADLSESLVDFDCYGMVDEPVGNRPTNAIFYRREAFRRVSASGYWLSKRPHVAGSKDWDSDCVRLANWVRLEEVTTGLEFRVVNTHLDYVGQTAREHQSALIVEDAQAYPDDYPQLLTGDMNCDTGNLAIGNFRKGGWVDTYGQVHGPADPGPTYHGFIGPDFKSNIGKMDWIFMRGAVNARHAEIIDDSREGRFPSDHYFVSATVELTGG